MKEFDLEKALAGEPVALRNGDKAFVKFVLENPLFEDDQVVGFHIDSEGKEEVTSWGNNGVHIPNTNSIYDIIGMWEEPRPTVTLTLPCPLKSVTVGQRVFYLDLNKQCERICAFLFQKDSTYHFNLLKNGGIFSTEEDAQAWFDAMKNARR
ncbi:pyruvate kinase [Pasteurella multocida]|uniref:pyruvate kinase n=1 Tax=Pasteurella multocida TaxID=747 RepID=UPI002A509BAC|nr:pyruvate kinase [Pasteurella multocida]MDY0576521.1 pyruvate kinase [Pasteurella multocida]MDY0625611.1 pyruvate kinase [Pasteurella multocida]MDY0678197.1 pyruvate kinase [Pasteurella multocida]MDY0681492.1 pyruvate kinase [Pasteurella multocida]